MALRENSATGARTSNDYRISNDSRGRAFWFRAGSFRTGRISRLRGLPRDDCRERVKEYAREIRVYLISINRCVSCRKPNDSHTTRCMGYNVRISDGAQT